MSKKHYKTKKTHFNAFMKECEYWIKFFGLFQWDFIYTHEITKENDSYASAQPDNQNRIVVLNLNPDWSDTKPTVSRIRRYAFHEISEVRYAKISGLPIEKLYGFLDEKKSINQNFILNLQGDICEATHALIRTDENCIWKPMYFKRFKRKIKLEE